MLPAALHVGVVLVAATVSAAELLVLHGQGAMQAAQLEARPPLMVLAERLAAMQVH